ncbi:MAG: HlyD family efflux transporter periplasmic adaptor subunit [Pseudomonadales bacterium]|nr:HlyD family efflux transporter periplasmic adaptor subunit [Pseudomonadales bacterium]
MRIMLLLVSIATLFACEPPVSDIPSMGTLEADRIDLVADSSEPVMLIHVREGDVVSAGQRLLEHDSSRARARLEKARADLAIARARLEEAEAGPRAEDIQRGRARLAAAESAVETARLEWLREKSLAEQNYVPKNRVDILKGRYEEAVARRDEARAALDELLAGTRSEEVDAARSAWHAARANVQDIQITLDRTVIEAPVDGIIEAVPFEIGERPAPGQTVVAMIADTGLYARVHVPEPLRTRLKPGSPAEIHIDGYQERLSGRVRWIAKEASFTPFFALTQHDRTNLSFLAEVDLVDTEVTDLPIGIPVQVYFPPE